MLIQESFYLGVQDRFFEATLKNTCEAALAAALHPRSSIIITIQELHNNGQVSTYIIWNSRAFLCYSTSLTKNVNLQLLSCALNAACLSCLDSNIDMKFLFASTTCFLTKDGTLQIRTPIKENIQAVFVFTFDSMNGRIVVSHTEGVYSVENYRLALEKCREQSKQVFMFMKSRILEKVISTWILKLNFGE